jgi:alkylglycerol monooxygenase
MRLETTAYYALGIPVFGALLWLEARVGARQGKRVFELPDTLSNLACGMGQLLVGLFTGPIVFLLYDWAYTFRIGSFDTASPWVWLLALIGVDFAYYWYHRAGHRIAALWTIHAVHHQSEELNFSVALRQPWFSDIYAGLFYWPFPFLGIPEVPMFAAVAVLSLNQVSLHTRVFSRRSFGIFNTPEFHGLHHALNARYQDRNFGASLIVWDRLFGTFTAPDASDPPRYGSSEQYVTHDAVRAQWLPARRLVASLRERVHAPTRFGAAREAVSTLLGTPPSLEPGPRARPASAIPQATQRIALVQFSVAIAVCSLLLWGRDHFGLGARALGCIFAISLFSYIGRKLDGVESARGERGLHSSSRVC